MKRSETPSPPMLAKPVGRLGAPSSATGRRLSKGTTQALGVNPEMTLEKILTLLGASDYRAAQGLAKDAAVRFPDHQGIRRMHRALNERMVTTRPASGVARDEEFAWLEDPPESARGKVVALVGDQMVASAGTGAELLERLRGRDFSKSPLVVRVY